MIWEEAAVAQFDTLRRHLTEGTEEDNGEHQSRLRYNPVTFRV